MGAISLVVMCLFLIGGLVVAYGTIAKNKWGINLDPIRCPSCGVAQPRVRKPTSLRQAMWGGQTCAVCGTEMDKWGRPIGPLLNSPEAR
jgi:hypothetical protein